MFSDVNPRVRCVYISIWLGPAAEQQLNWNDKTATHARKEDGEGGKVCL